MILPPFSFRNDKLVKMVVHSFAIQSGDVNWHDNNEKCRFRAIFKQCLMHLGASYPK